MTPRTALVLSAGGMFGSYQAGVWSELAPLVKPDVVVGASVGSLNGYMIASGCPPDRILEEWRQLEAASRHRWRIPRRLHEGFLDGSNFEARLSRMCTEWTPQVPFGLVATELRALRPRLFRSPEITWQHLAASCAVPVFLRHHRFEGALYTDGGLLNPLPLWAAVEMGATRIIAVNLLEHRPWPIRCFVRAANMVSPFKAKPAAEIELIRIAPAGPLGSARDSMYWDPGRTERWITLGRQDAVQAKHLVVECFGRN